MFSLSPLCFEVDKWDKAWRPSVAEVGAGTGLFSVAQAALSKTKVVAVDVKADRLQKGATLAVEQKTANVRFLRTRADQMVDLLQSHSLKDIWVTFPDPFPKKRAAKHRLTHPRFLKMYDSLLVPGGSLLLKSDVEDLFRWSLEQLVEEGWTIHELTFDLHSSNLQDNYKVMTTYEKRFYEEGLPISFVRASPNRT